MSSFQGLKKIPLPLLKMVPGPAFHACRMSRPAQAPKRERHAARLQVQSAPKSTFTTGISLPARSAVPRNTKAHARRSARLSPHMFQVRRTIRFREARCSLLLKSAGPARLLPRYIPPVPALSARRAYLRKMPQATIPPDARRYRLSSAADTAAVREEVHCQSADGNIATETVMLRRRCTGCRALIDAP